jgi:hypothetical protein
MENNNLYSFITYLFLTILIVVIFSLSFKYKFKSAQKLSFRSLTNKNSNAVIKENYNNMNVKEGFKEGLSESNYNKNETDSIFKMIDNKLRGLTLELGGNEGRSETKKILTSTKKICDMECAKCMMTMLNDKKSINSINIEGILDDETDENCIKCKKYTALSTSITSIINNL